MKKRLFSIITLLLCCLLALFATSCSGGVDTDKAKEDINEFFAAVGEGDYDIAATYLHPDTPVDLAAYFAAVEREEGVDFSQGVTLVDYTGFSYAYYDSEVDGSRYAPEIDARVGNVAVDIEIEVVQNDNGYGISFVEIEADD